MKIKLMGYWTASTNNGTLEWMVLKGSLHKLRKKRIVRASGVLAAGKLTYRHMQMHGNSSIAVSIT